MRERRVDLGDRERIAELEESIRRLDAAVSREREANVRKDEFLAILSHEMRSPLNAMLTWVQVLRSGRIDATTTEQALASLERSARSQARMIEDLLDTSRIISGKLSIEVQETDLAQIVKNAVDIATSAAVEKQVALECDLEAKPLAIRGDPVRLQQVIGNLLSNGVKFTPSGGKITIALRLSDDDVEIEVTDSGCGISSALLPHIFDPFRQGDVSITRRHGGLGLGLAIAKHLIELHGGSISAESTGEGQGATFRVRMRTDHSRRPSEGKASKDRSPRRGTLSGLRVLLVDDDPDTCMALSTVLREAGSRVRIARSVGDALRLFEREEASVVLTDLAMPESDGFELIGALRVTKNGREVPVIALTGSAGPQARKRVREAGFVLHLTKPVDPAEVVAAVEMAVSGRANEFAQIRS